MQEVGVLVRYFLYQACVQTGPWPQSYYFILYAFILGRRSGGLVQNDGNRIDLIMMNEDDVEDSGIDHNPIWSDDTEDEDMEKAAFDMFDVDEIDEALQSGNK
jgi:hypothetical protein